MPGPAPKHPSQRRRRNKAPELVQLPASGRRGVPPKFPLAGRAAKGQAELWRELWSTPQAVAWERLGWVRTVARYCRVTLAAEAEMHPAVLAEARQLEDRLGLSPMAMKRLGWEVAADELAVQREERQAKTSRQRMKAVDGDAVAGG